MVGSLGDSVALMMAPPRQSPSLRNEMVKTKSEPAARIRQLMENLQGGNASKEKKQPKHYQKLRVERAPVADTNERTAPNTSSEGGGGGDHWGRGGGNHNQIDPARADSSQGAERPRPKLDRVHLSNDGLHAIEDEEDGGDSLPQVS